MLTKTGNAHQDSGENPRRFAALGNAHQDNGQMPLAIAITGHKKTGHKKYKTVDKATNAHPLF